MKGITLRTFVVAAGSLLAAASLTFGSSASAETTLELRARLDAQAAAARAAAATAQAKARCEAENTRRRAGMLPGPIVDCSKLATTTTATDTIAPAVPAGVRAAASSATRVSLGWSASTDSGGSGLKGYDVYRNGTRVTQVMAPAIAWIDPNVSPATSYRYQLAAFDGKENRSAMSAAAVATTPAATTTPPPAPTVDTTPPSVPGGVQAAAKACNAIDVTWNASADSGGSGLKGYDVYRDGNMLTQVMAPLSGLSDSALQAATGHSYAVAAFDGKGNRSARSGAQSATTPACSAGGVPRVLGSLAGFGYPEDLYLDASKGVVIGLALDGLTIADVTDPAHPAISARIAPLGAIRHTAVAMRDGLAYVVGGGQDSASILVVLDVGDPQHPVVLSRMELPGTGMPGIALNGSLVYVGNAGGLHVLEILSAQGIRLLQSVRTSEPLAAQIVVGEGYILSRTASGVAWFDARSPRSPQLAGSVALAGTLGILGKIAYVSRATGFYVLDLTDLTKIALRNTIVVPESRDLRSVAIDKGRLMLPSATGIIVFDISDPARPLPIGEVKLPALGLELANGANLLVATDRSGTLNVLSVGP
jgi:chitodextrinase